MAFADLIAEISGAIPGISPLLVSRQINRAWLDIRQERRWSFLQADGVIVCPLMVTAGAVAITQYSPTVTCNAAASAALPAVGATPDITQMQIRFGGSSTLTVGQIYRIMAVDRTVPTAIVLTLDRNVVELTNATSTYQSYRCYVTPPNADFLAWEQIVDMVYGWKVQLNWTSGQFDMIDPQRTMVGDAYRCGFFRVAGPYGNSNTADPNVEEGSPIYELWPGPTSGRTFYARFVRKGSDFVNPTDTQPAMINDSLILSKALGWYSYPFAMANTANFPTLKGQNWMALVQSAKQDYKGNLIQAKKNDDAQALQNVLNRGHGLRNIGSEMSFPVDAAFIQSHLLRF